MCIVHTTLILDRKVVEMSGGGEEVIYFDEQGE
jgi:hypothetical protein